MTSIKRPTCTICLSRSGYIVKMHRLSVNEYNGDTNEALPIGWFCKNCSNIELDLLPK